jgi:uncharacterized membrane protein YhaH (DUF805 family)
MLLAYRRPFEFTGRSTRTELLGYLIISWLVSAIASRALLIWLRDFDPASSAVVVINLLLSIPMPALAVRRAHDTGRPWYWSLPLLVPMLLTFVVGSATLGTVSGLVPVLGVLNVVGLVILFWKPTDEANEFGSNPRLDPEPSYEPA